MGKLLGFDALQQSVNAYQKKPLSLAQRCSALEAGFAPHELIDADQAFCKKHEDAIFKRKSNQPATFKQLLRLMEFYEVAPTTVDVKSFDPDSFTFDVVRKQISAVLRDPSSKYYDGFYAEEALNRFKKKHGELQ